MAEKLYQTATPELREDDGCILRSFRIGTAWLNGRQICQGSLRAGIPEGRK